MKIFNDKMKNRVEFLDERFYIDGENFYPSVTTVLDAYPKGERFMQWLKDVGDNAEDIVKRAADKGSKVHDACERLIKGETLSFDNYDVDEWKMVLKFQDFCVLHEPTIEGLEHNLISKALGVGGTIDLVATINGERWLIDNKTSSAIYDNHFVQIAVYAAMWNEAYPDQKIDRIGCLHLRALTRGVDKTGKKIQGAGWRVEEPTESISELVDIFKHVHALWRRINPNGKPMNLVLPNTAKLSLKKNLH